MQICSRYIEAGRLAVLHVHTSHKTNVGRKFATFFHFFCVSVIFAGGGGEKCITNRVDGRSVHKNVGSIE